MGRWRTKQIRRCAYLLLIIASLAHMTSCKYLILAKGYPKYKGEFRGLPLNVYSLQAEELLPKLFAYSFHDEKAAAAVEILKSWGRLHTYYWKHAGGNNWFTAMLLNSGPYPADGNCTTVNANTYNAAKDEYKAISIAALRMVIPLDDLDGMQIIAPMGQSGQPGHKHYDDIIEAWIKSELVHLPSSRRQVEAAAVSEMTLSP